MKAGEPSGVSRETIRSGARPGGSAALLSESHLRMLKEIARVAGVPLPSRFRPACEAFLAELTKWNKRINLISMRDRTRIVERHVLDSLCLLAYEPRLAGKHVLDVGPGAGFPGLVLAMWDVSAQVTLVESRSKPVAFLRAVRRSIGLENVKIVHARLESVAGLGQTPPVDIVTSRAVGGTLRLAEHAAPLLKPCGAVVVYAARKLKGGAHTAPSVSVHDAAILKRMGYSAESMTPLWQSLTSLLILRKLDQSEPTGSLAG